MRMTTPGRASGEGKSRPGADECLAKDSIEKDAKGPCEEENHIHPTIRERDDDWWKEEG